MSIRGFFRDAAGSTAMIFAVAVPVLMLMLAAAVDYGRAQLAATQMQTAADEAALAALGTAQAGRTALAASVVQAALSTRSDLSTAPPVATTNADGSVTVTVTGDLDLTLARLLQPSVRLSRTATAYRASAAGDVCVLVLDPASAQSLLLNSGASINAPSCEIDVASTGGPAAIVNAGVTLNIRSLCVKGASVLENGGHNPVVSTSCATASDPFAGALPGVSVGGCTVSNMNYAGATTLYPGVYCGTFNFNGTGTLNLNPGLYVFSNAHWNLNSGWTLAGTGVTFYFSDASSWVQVNSNARINVTAPTSGTYANILMYEPAGLARSSFSIDGSAGHALSGLIYLPSRNVTFNSVSNVTSESLTMVFNQLILDNVNWSFSSSAWKIPGSVSAAGGVARLSR